MTNAGCAENAECVIGSAAGSGEAGASGEGGGICLLREGAPCDPAEELCSTDLVCARNTADEDRCYGRVVLRGIVTETRDDEPLEGAHVMALNEEGVAVTDIAVSASGGEYELDVPAVRDEEGAPISAPYTLRADAADHQPFPSGIRVALPIDVGEAVRDETIYVVENALTNVGLIPLPDAARFALAGSIVGLDDESPLGGALVVASGAAGTFSAIADRSGHYTIFNLPPGSYEVRVYASDLQVEGTTIEIEEADLSSVDLDEIDRETTTVSGNIQIVNAPGGSMTSVILVVEDTFSETAARGEVPRGLRAPRSGAPSVDGDFTIEGVPAGRYVVLAAYENDALVRDPDTNIAGTGFVHIEVTADQETLTVDESFKVTEALATVAPGVDGPEAVSEAPTLEWADDSSEDWYDLRVFDAFGDEVWSSLEIPGVSGSDTVSVQYEGPLEPGMYYQFRVTSWRAPGGGDPAPISSTEDLRGVFFLPAD